MIYALSGYIIFVNLKNVIDSRLTRNILKMDLSIIYDSIFAY